MLEDHLAAVRKPVSTGTEGPSAPVWDPNVSRGDSGGGGSVATHSDASRFGDALDAARCLCMPQAAAPRA
jgi:hypothetical protein